MLLAPLTTILLAITVGDSSANLASVDINQLNGQTIAADLVSVERDQITVDVDGESQILKHRDLYSVTFPDALDNEDVLPPENPVYVDFTDGSSIQSQAVDVTEGRATISFESSDPLRASTRLIHSIRFYPPVPELSQQWQEITSATSVKGDVLVIRKSQVVEDQDGIEEETIGLDSLEGVIHAVNESGVVFEFDETRVTVPRQKVEGLIYFHRSSDRQAETKNRVFHVDGSVWNLRSCETDDNTLKGISAGGVRVAIPLSAVTKLDFSVGNLVFLSDLDPTSFEWKSDPNLPTVLTSAPTMYRMRRDESFFNGPITLNAHSFEKGVALKSQSRLTYRLTQDFARLAAVAGIDDQCRAEGNVTLTVSGNGKVLMQEVIAGSKQVEIDINLRGVRRLEILVDFGDDGIGYGDFLNLGNARLMK